MLVQDVHVEREWIVGRGLRTLEIEHAEVSRGTRSVVCVRIQKNLWVKTFFIALKVENLKSSGKVRRSILN